MRLIEVRPTAAPALPPRMELYGLIDPDAPATSGVRAIFKLGNDAVAYAIGAAGQSGVLSTLDGVVVVHAAGSFSLRGDPMLALPTVVIDEAGGQLEMEWAPAPEEWVSARYRLPDRLGSIYYERIPTLGALQRRRALMAARASRLTVVSGRDCNNLVKFAHGVVLTLDTISTLGGVMAAEAASATAVGAVAWVPALANYARWTRDWESYWADPCDTGANTFDVGDTALDATISTFTDVVSGPRGWGNLARTAVEAVRGHTVAIGLDTFYEWLDRDYYLGPTAKVVSFAWGSASRVDTGGGLLPPTTVLFPPPGQQSTEPYWVLDSYINRSTPRSYPSGSHTRDDVGTTTLARGDVRSAPASASFAYEAGQNGQYPTDSTSNSFFWRSVAVNGGVWAYVHPSLRDRARVHIRRSAAAHCLGSGSQMSIDGVVVCSGSGPSSQPPSSLVTTYSGSGLGGGPQGYIGVQISYSSGGHTLGAPTAADWGSDWMLNASVQVSATVEIDGATPPVLDGDFVLVRTVTEAGDVYWSVIWKDASYDLDNSATGDHRVGDGVIGTEVSLGLELPDGSIMRVPAGEAGVIVPNGARFRADVTVYDDEGQTATRTDYYRPLE